MPATLPPGKSIQQRFRYVVTELYLVVVGLVLSLFGLQWQGYRDAHEAKKEFTALQAALHAMADVSAERRPAYAVIVLDEPTPAEWLVALKTARESTDARMAELGAALRDPDCSHCAMLLPTWEQAYDQIALARRELDAMHHHTGTDAQVLEAFGHLSDAIPRLSSIAEIDAVGVIRQNADVQSYLLVARLSGLLREQAGMIVSQFGPAVISRRALTDQEAFDIARTLGKIEQLRLLLLPSVRILPPSLQADYDRLDKVYFGEALIFLDQVRQDAARSGGVSESPLQLAERYGPLIAPINTFRDDAMALAGKTIDESLRQHVVYLIASGIFAAVLTGMLMFLIWRFRERIIQPVAEARRFILAIASGNLSAVLPRKRYSSEVQELFSALIVLKENGTRRLKLEKERKRMIGELRVMAETDALTGLLNRRAFETRTRVLLADKRSHDPVVAVMMIDIDHFKRVNDTYGHDNGDKALVMLANVCRETMRSDDIVARFGGEEFVVLSRVQAAQEGQALAERLRLRLHDEKVLTLDGQTFGFTISIGVAFALRDQGTAIDVEQLLREADALLYRAKQNGRDRVETEVA
ncbi:diguanylate cyclase (GGDEF) domain-containing protein [Dyella jiangningensis]|uniref:GGDEF domain-containing protein n=2 Tax=Gammaproteobacteria TaxID=1236 RepID=UPI0008813818|nr:GGDEF domain-containing protein [Dyella sp. AtDHG13]PXV60719.1 diguanylate cyclase (GGDEF)-like protein [Dyella sp. AtDHG13]SDL00519.1 diguanylate cyclase (GGDEF) domain-containing protein [Dyella jiangningensis]